MRQRGERGEAGSACAAKQKDSSSRRWRIRKNEGLIRKTKKVERRWVDRWDACVPAWHL